MQKRVGARAIVARVKAATCVGIVEGGGEGKGPQPTNNSKPLEEGFELSHDDDDLSKGRGVFLLHASSAFGWGLSLPLPYSYLFL